MEGILCKNIGSRLLFLFSLTMIVSGVQHFTEEPEDITVKLGDRVTLPCKVAEMKGTLQWTQDGFGLGTNRSLHGFNRYEMTGSADQGEYNLFIRTVLVSDDAEYQCQVGAADGDPIILSSKGKLTVQIPPTDNEDMVSIDKNSPVLTTADMPVRLSCMARSAKPEPEIKWFKGDEQISSGVTNEVLPLPDSLLKSVRSTLDLTPDQSYHNANLSCQVSHVALESPITRSVSMEVRYPPEVTITVDSVKIKEGDDVNLTCNAKANPPDLSYRWEVGGVTVVGDKQTYLLLKNVKRERNGEEVKCFVTNAIGETAVTHTLAVNYMPRFKSEPVDVDEKEGENVELSCDVDGNPSPEIVWTHMDSDKVIKLGSEITVKVSRETVGTYHCRAAVTGFAEVSRSMKIYMRGVPRVIPHQVYYGLEGQGVNVAVMCRVHSIPRPTSLLWSRDGEIIYPSQKYTIRENRTRDGILNTLVIRDPHYEDFGIYNCTARNEYGQHSDYITLRRHQSLPLITTLVAIIGGIIFLVIVVAAIVLFRRKGLDYKDSAFEKHSMHSTDHSSSNDSVLKVETRTGTYTGTASELSPSDGEEDDFSNEDWESTNIDEEPRRYTDTEGPGTYVPYGNYQRDYIPPSLNSNRNTIYTTVPINNINNSRMNQRFGNPSPQNLSVVSGQTVMGPSPTPGGPYSRIPNNARMNRNVYGSSGALAGQRVNLPKFTPNLGPPNTDFGANVGPGTMSFGLNGSAQSISNNLNHPNNMIDKNLLNRQLNNPRNNINRQSNIPNNGQYISIPQNDLDGGGMGTHI